MKWFSKPRVCAIEMRRPVFVATLGLAVCLAGFCWHSTYRSSVEVFTDSKATPPEPAPLCPWREPEADLKLFFPGAATYKTETRILSGQRLEMAARLGRQPTGDENALRLNRVCQTNSVVGTVLTSRVKGEFGGIEIVLATDNQRVVRGVRLQRLREPEANAAALQDSHWLNAFNGKRASDPWRIGDDIPAVPAGAQTSAAAIVEGVRALLVLQEVAEKSQTSGLAATGHH